MIADLPEWDDHEGVHVFHDRASGLHAIVGVHSTHLGPGAGGTRLWTYPDERAAVRDVLRLSRAMSYKNAMAGLALGGGKGVILRPSAAFDRTALMRAYGRALEACGGTYKTAEDVGVGTADMDIIASETAHVAGVSRGPNAGGDPSPWTALGIFLGIQATVERVFGTGNLEGRTVAVQGLGSVGYTLAEHLAEAGARLLVADIDTGAVARAERELRATAVEPDRIHAADADIFAPCALSHAVSAGTVDGIRARIVAGGANNQIESESVARRLHARGILHAPDYVLNAGGIINVASELSGTYSAEWTEAKVRGIPDTLRDVFDRADAEDEPPSLVADRMARERIGR